MQECIERIQLFTATGRAQFFADVMVQDAVLRNLHTLSESSTHLSSELKTLYPWVPWAAMRGFRNVVVHDYLGVDLDEIWGIIEQDIPPLKEAIQEILTRIIGPG
jgi:uncharacterized protein with HEPN domain